MGLGLGAKDVSNAPELAAELHIIASKMRELGVVRLKTEKVEIELGALPTAPAPKPREISDDKFMFAATEGIEEDDEADDGT